MSPSLVWINAGNAQSPKLSEADKLRVRAQARREAVKREREHSISALHHPSKTLKRPTIRSVASSRASLQRTSPRSDHDSQVVVRTGFTDASSAVETALGPVLSPIGRLIDSPSNVKAAGDALFPRWRSFDSSGSSGSVSESDDRAAPPFAAPAHSTAVIKLGSTESGPAARSLHPIAPMIYSPAVAQQALESAFVEGHFSKSAQRLFSVVSQDAEEVVPRSRSWEAATNALGLLQLASVKDSPRLAEEGQMQYLTMLDSLQEELVSRSLDLAAVTGTVNHLLLCEVYSAVPQSAQSRQTHIDGLVTVVARLHTTSTPAPLTALVLHSARIILLTHALVIRSPVPVQAISLGDCEHMDATGGLFHHAMRVPSLLHAVDNASRSCNVSTPFLSLAEKVNRLESDLAGWLEHNPLPTSASEKEETPIWIAPHPALQAPLERLEEVFGHALGLASFNAANMYVLYWVCILVLRAALLDLSSLAVSHDGATLEPVAARDLRDECYTCASSLCRIIPFLLRSAGGNVSQAASIRAPLHFAQLAFEKTNSTLELKCVRQVEAEMQSHFRTLNWDALLPWSFLALIWQTEM